MATAGCGGEAKPAAATTKAECGLREQKLVEGGQTLEHMFKLYLENVNLQSCPITQFSIGDP